MPKISTVRKRKMQAQGGLCYYCGQPMWAENPETFCQAFGVPRREVQLFQCTAEHLLPRSEGGLDSDGNIVAACLFCNRTRHTFKQPLAPVEYRRLVRRLKSAGYWLQLPERCAGGSSPNVRT